MSLYPTIRMAAAREKHRAHRKKSTEAAKIMSVKLVQPMQQAESTKIREKIKITTSSRGALVPGEGRSMGMEID